MTLWQYAHTQWRSSGFGATGLDFPAVLALADRLGIYVSPAVLRKLRMIEEAVLDHMAQKE